MPVRRCFRGQYNLRWFCEKCTGGIPNRRCYSVILTGGCLIRTDVLPAVRTTSGSSAENLPEVYPTSGVTPVSSPGGTFLPVLRRSGQPLEVLRNFYRGNTQPTGLRRSGQPLVVLRKLYRGNTQPTGFPRLRKPQVLLQNIFRRSK